jgi:sialate O-acetylesterase
MADVRLHGIFTSNMVLQREKPIPVCGWAAPGEDITVTLDTDTAKAKADNKGAWQVELPARATGENLDMTVIGKNTITLKNLIMGDIWVCSGQSNMEFTANGSNTPEDIKTSDIPKIRCFKVNHTPSGNAEVDFPKWSPHGPWQICNPQTVGRFTAVGFYFAREIVQQTGVPIGIIDDNWGGTAIEPWIAPTTLDAVTEMAPLKKNYDNAWAAYNKQLPAQLDKVDEWIKATRAAIANNQELPALIELPRNPIWSNGDGVKSFALFNGMISPIIRVPITGALWYQGESNGGDDDIYYHKMRALIGGWRSLWKQGDFPFYFVQLANFTTVSTNPAGGDGYAKIRNAQTKSMSIPHTGMATIIDIGEANDIHPKNKQDVGKRLSLWALKNDYGKKDITVTSGPMFKSIAVEGNKIRITFDSIGSGLFVGQKNGRNPVIEDIGGKLQRFAIAGEDKNWVWADAVIEGDNVVVSSDKVPAPVAVRYAYAANPAGCNLYNKENLPAVPFRSDNW